jgi:alpha-tubulin suppressor-like RCC1 family protein
MVSMSSPMTETIHTLSLQAALGFSIAVGCTLLACKDAEHPPSPVAVTIPPPSPLARDHAQSTGTITSTPIIARPSPMITRLSTSDPTCGLDTDGGVWRWSTGELEPDAPSIRGAVSIACGMSHSCIVAADGKAWCWGNNGYGALGDGTEESHEEPSEVVGLSSIAEIAVDYGRTCARTTNGDVHCWGDSEFGKAGDGRMPDNVGREKVLPGKAILSGASSLAVGMAHACSAMQDGRLSCWGQNNAGSCGQAAKVRYVPRPLFVPKTKDVVAVSTGESVTCSLDRQGALACWEIWRCRARRSRASSRSQWATLTPARASRRARSSAGEAMRTAASEMARASIERAR